MDIRGGFYSTIMRINRGARIYFTVPKRDRSRRRRPYCNTIIVLYRAYTVTSMSFQFPVISVLDARLEDIERFRRDEPRDRVTSPVPYTDR